MDELATLILALVGAYAAVGVLFAVAFVTAGASRVDPAAAGAPWGFRALIFPGAAALWPVMLQKWRRAARGRPHKGPVA
jgi:hypothetical protein